MEEGGRIFVGRDFDIESIVAVVGALKSLGGGRGRRVGRKGRNIKRRQSNDANQVHCCPKLAANRDLLNLALLSHHEFSIGYIGWNGTGHFLLH